MKLLNTVVISYMNSQTMIFVIIFNEKFLKKFLGYKYKMPGPRPKGKPRVIRRRRFAKRRVQKTTNVNRSLQPIPSRYICKMKYAETVYSDVTGQYIFNLNSLYDPNRTGVGHQPYGYDPLAQLYNRYRVISCGWRITSPTNSYRQIGCMPSNDSGITYTTFSEMKENPRAKYIVQATGAQVAVLHGKSYIPALMGRTKAQYMADDNYQATVTSSPAELALLYIQTSTAGDVGEVGAAIQVILEYTVEFFDIKHIVQS